MKKTPTKIMWIGFFLVLSFYSPVTGGKRVDDPALSIEPPVLIDPDVYLYRAGDIFLGGQPKEKTLDSLAKAGVTLIINIRTDPEVMTHDKEEYPEEDYIKGIGLEYIQIPIGGDAGYTPEAIARIDEAIEKTEGKVLIHCRTAMRATLAWMAWLVRYRDYTLDEAVELGKKARFSFPLEDLLGFPVSFQKGE